MTLAQKILRQILPALVFCAVASFRCAGMCAEAGKAEDWRISREADHFRSVATERFMEGVDQAGNDDPRYRNGDRLVRFCVCRTYRENRQGVCDRY